MPNVALPFTVPAFVAATLGSGAVVLAETIASHITSGFDTLANAASGTGLLRTVERVSDRADGVANYFQGRHFQITNDMLDWSIRPTLPSPALDTPIVTNSGSGLASGTYYYVVTVRNNASGQSNWVTGMNFVSARIGPTVASGTIKIGWEAIDNALDYRVYRTKTLTSSMPDFSGTGNGLLKKVVGATTYTDNGTAAVTAATDPPTANTAFDEPLSGEAYEVDYTYSRFRFKTPKKYWSLEDVIRDHGFGSQAAIMAEFAMSTVPGRGNGAPACWITAAGNPANPTQTPSLAHYQSALTGFSTILDDHLVVVMGAQSNNIRQQLKQYVETESNLENKREKIAFTWMPNGTAIGASNDSTSLLGQAALMASKRIVLLAIDSGSADTEIQDATTGTRIRGISNPEYVAAMAAGKLSSLSDPAEPLTRKAIIGPMLYKGAREYNPTEMKALRNGGCMTIDYRGESNWNVFQAVTTKTSDQDDFELSVVLAADTMAFAWREAIDPSVPGGQASLIGSKLTPGLLDAVRVRTVVVLDTLVNQGVISGYDINSIGVQADPVVKTRVNVTWNYQPVFPVNTVIATFSTSFTLNG
jgi:hypothetical protein